MKTKAFIYTLSLFQMELERERTNRELKTRDVQKLKTKTRHSYDIRLRPVIATPLAFHASPYGPLRPNVTSSMKPEVHNVSQYHQRRTEPRPRGIRTNNFVEVGPEVSEICSWTDRHTDRRTDRQTDKLIAILRFPRGLVIK